MVYIDIYIVYSYISQLVPSVNCRFYAVDYTTHLIANHIRQRVFLLLGNRDINKLRFAAELVLRSGVRTPEVLVTGPAGAG